VISQLDVPFRGVVYKKNHQLESEQYPRIEEVLRRRREPFTLPINVDESLQLRFVNKYSRDYLCQGVYKTNKRMPVSQRTEIIAHVASERDRNSNHGVHHYIGKVFDHIYARYNKISFVLSDYGFLGRELDILYKNGGSKAVPLKSMYDLKDARVEHTNFCEKFGDLGLDECVRCEGIVVSWMNPHFSCRVSRELKKSDIYALPVVIFVI
jgi:hypothetical protein